MATKPSRFEQVSDLLYATADWSVVVEKTGALWTVNEHGMPKHTERTAAEALDWAERWLDGEVRA